MREAREGRFMLRKLACPPVAVALACAWAALAAPAAADGGLTISAGPSFVINSDAQGPVPKTLTNVGLGYDFGPKTIIPVRLSLDADYAGGSSNGGSLNEFGAGLGVRLTTPLYVGVTGSVYNVNVHPGSTLVGGNVVSPPAQSTTGFGETFFAGEKLFGIPGGAGLALQATYRRLPSLPGFDPSSFTVGLRLSL
jgi:hypothetical protein